MLISCLSAGLAIERYYGGSGGETMSVEGADRRGGGDARPERERADGGSATAATFQVTIPEPFTFSRPEEWVKWSRRFERFRVVSGLAQRDEEVQVNTLIYAVGDQADDILHCFKLS